MHLGLFLSSQHPPQVDARVAVAEHLEQVAFAREHGFASVFCGQHFLSHPFQMFQPVPLLGRVAAEAGEMRVGCGILLTSLLNPLEVAEHAATLDVLCGGRFVLGVGLGYRPEENRAFGVTRDRVGTFTARLEVIRALLAGEAVTADGPGYALEDARLTLRPVQRPRPPLWMAANSDTAVRRAATEADTWLVHPHATEHELARQLEIFRAARGTPPDELPAIREVCVRPTTDEALEVARPHLDQKYKAYVTWGQSEALESSDTLRRAWEDLRRDRFLLGDPETVADGLRRHRDELGVTEVVCRVQWPGLPHADALRTLELLAAEVLPRLR